MFYVNNIIEMRNMALKENKISLKQFNEYNIEYLKELIEFNIDSNLIKFKDEKTEMDINNIRDNLILLLNDLKV
tara:strand:- start:122 stop:343 length:222 start_codon:yes stop_codon:yes gene_type:complete